MEKIVFAGSFDPLTNGHLWVIQEGLNIAKEVVVFVAENNTKKTMFSAQERLEMIQKTCSALPNGDRISVMIINNEYTARKAIQIGATHLIRGIRSSGDFDYESLIQKTNTDVIRGAKTLFVMPPRELESVSSSFVKSLVGPIGWHFHIKSFLPPLVYENFLKKFIEKTFLEHFKPHLTQDYQASTKFLDLVFSNYSAPHRHYHNLEHITHCLQEMLWLKNNFDLSIDYTQLTVAILAHDIVYGQHSKDFTDEQLSSQLLLDIFGNNFLLASSLVLATQHFITDSSSLSEEAKIMRSIDLAILGQDQIMYNSYVANIKKEYCHIPQDVFNSSRLKALKSLNEKTLFESPYFSHYEEIAHCNLNDEIYSLS